MGPMYCTVRTGSDYTGIGEKGKRGYRMDIIIYMNIYLYLYLSVGLRVPLGVSPFSLSHHRISHYYQSDYFVSSSFR